MEVRSFVVHRSHLFNLYVQELSSEFHSLANVMHREPSIRAHVEYWVEGKDHNGRSCVVMPETTHVRRKKRKVDKSILEQTLDDGTDTLQRGQAERKFANVSLDIANSCSEIAPVAVGVPQNQLLKPTSPRVGNMNPSSVSSVASAGRRLLKRDTSNASASDLEPDLRAVGKSSISGLDD